MLPIFVIVLHNIKQILKWRLYSLVYSLQYKFTDRDNRTSPQKMYQHDKFNIIKRIYQGLKHKVSRLSLSSLLLLRKEIESAVKYSNIWFQQRKIYWLGCIHGIHVIKILLATFNILKNSLSYFFEKIILFWRVSKWHMWMNERGNFDSIRRGTWNEIHQKPYKAYEMVERMIQLRRWLKEIARHGGGTWS